METKEIEKILNEIGITEDNCHIMTSAYTSIPIHDIVVDYIQQFMNHIEKLKQAKLLMALATVREYPSWFKEPSIDYLDSLLSDNKRLREENEKLKEKINNSEIVYTGGCDAATGNVSIIKTIT